MSLLRCALVASLWFACGDSTTDDDDKGSAGTGPTASGAGGVAGSGGGSGSGSGSGASGSGGSSGGGLPDCVTDVVPLGAQGETFRCSFAIPPEHLDAEINLVLNGQVVCWRASSQGCDVGGHPGGWWYRGGDEVALCDSTCTTLVEVPGTQLDFWVGCESDTCL